MKTLLVWFGGGIAVGVAGLALLVLVVTVTGGPAAPTSPISRARAVAVSRTPAHAPRAVPQARLVCNAGVVARGALAPARCLMLPHSEHGYQLSLAQGSDLRQLRWTGWGRARATATGCDQAFHLQAPCTQVRVVASVLRGGRYRRLRVTSKGGSTTFTPDAPGTTNPASAPAPAPAAAAPKPEVLPACPGQKFNAQGTCLSDPTFRALCAELYATYRAGGGGGVGGLAAPAQTAIEQYGKFGCDQPTS